MSGDVDVIAAVLAERMSKGTSGRYIAAFTETPETLAAAIAAALTPAREDEAAIKAAALREAADDITVPNHDCFKSWCPHCAVKREVASRQRWLRDRADRIENGATDE